MTDCTLFRRLSLLLLCCPLVFLAGCPGDNPSSGTASAPSKTSAATIAPTITQPAQNAATGSPAQSATQAQANDAAQGAKMQQLITTAEASYSSGVKNYQANRLDAARLDFDYAVDSMLSSGFDLQAPGPLADEFERLVDAINSLEMAALRQGNGLSPRIEEAPVDTANDLTFAPNPELVAKLKSELNVTSDLPLVINDEVAGYIGVYSSSSSFRAHMAASLQRVGKYRGLIQNVLKEEGVPQDLIYLAVAESGFQPQVVNGRSGAGGMWQFMPATGAEYGLTRNGYFDYRFDPEKSTRAYARYIKALYKQFGDWYLAMAAYNWSATGVTRDVEKTGYADYWELRRLGLMPAETRAYVPQILAAVIMAKNPERYGLNKLVPSPAVIYDSVTVNYAIDIRLVADVTQSSVAEIAALNPSLLRFTTPSDIPFDLHLPPGTKDLYNDRLKDIPEDRRASWRFHIVKPGETVASIAASLHARPEDIAETNGITAADPMAVDDELVIPVQTYATAAAPQRYTMRRGDTLVAIADRFNISLDQLRRWNNLGAFPVRPGRTLYVAEPVRLAPSMRAHGRSAGRGRSWQGRVSYARSGSSAKRGRASAQQARTFRPIKRGKASSKPARAAYPKRKRGR
jgi:membrane-bound lytic murein transglycosylase D